MSGTLQRLAENSRRAIDDGIYNVQDTHHHTRHDMAGAIKAKREGACIISEVKFASPSLGIITTHTDHTAISQKMVSGGAAAISVLTQPYLFGGSPEYFTEIRESVSVPMLMKDIILDHTQIDAASNIGADCILLIQAIFDAGHACNIDEYISKAHDYNMQVLLEVHSDRELESALKTDCDIIGVNNRNLDTLKISLDTTEHVLRNYADERPAISESGIESPDDIVYLNGCGASAFLVGTSIMKGGNIKRGVERLVKAL